MCNYRDENEIFACPKCWKVSKGFTNRNGQRQSYSACHTADVTKVQVFPPETGALRGDVNKQLFHSTSPILLCSWGTNAAPRNAHSDGEETPQLPRSVIPNPEPTICCSPRGLPWQAPQQGSVSIRSAWRQCPVSWTAARSYGARLPPSSSKNTLSRLLILSSSTGRTTF